VTKTFFSKECILVNKWSTRFKKGAIELSVWIEEDVKKALFSTEYILVNKWSTRFKKGAIELSVWIEEDVKNAFFSNGQHVSKKVL
jgi:hypothetical protein